jgi:hypothetical protein
MHSNLKTFNTIKLQKIMNYFLEIFIDFFIF